MFVALVMDIGGTNIRLGLLKQGEYIPTYIKSFKINTFAHLADVIALFFADAPRPSCARSGDCGSNTRDG